MPWNAGLRKMQHHNDKTQGIVSSNGSNLIMSNLLLRAYTNGLSLQGLETNYPLTFMDRPGH